MAKGGGQMDGREDGRTDGRLEIPPCILQDIGPSGPLPKKEHCFYLLTHAYFRKYAPFFAQTLHCISSQSQDTLPEVQADIGQEKEVAEAEDVYV